MTCTRTIVTTTTALTATLGLGSPLLASVGGDFNPTFDDLSIGTVLAAGDAVTTSSTGIMVLDDGTTEAYSPIDLESGCFELSHGGEFCSGSITVVEAPAGLGHQSALALRNASVSLEWTGAARRDWKGFMLEYLEQAGNINLTTHDTFVNVADMADLEGLDFPGWKLVVHDRGEGQVGLLEIRRDFDQVVGDSLPADWTPMLRIGGYDLILDGQPAVFDERVMGTTDLAGFVALEDTTLELDRVRISLEIPDGGAAGLAQGIWHHHPFALGFENASATLDFATGAGTLRNPRIALPVQDSALGELGFTGQISINGSAPATIEWGIEQTGLVVGDCTLRIEQIDHEARPISHSHTQLIIEGDVRRMTLQTELVGGVSTIWAEDTLPPLDLDGDGCVDSIDLGLLFVAWGTADADFNGDGITDAIDMGILLGRWGC